MSITTQEAAERLKITDARVRRLILDGRLPAKKFGKRSWMIEEQDLELLKGRKPGRPVPQKETRSEQ